MDDGNDERSSGPSDDGNRSEGGWTDGGSSGDEARCIDCGWSGEGATGDGPRTGFNDDGSSDDG
jgi:hypothetical protein